MNNQIKEFYDKQAILFAEHYGIIEYKVNYNKHLMIYNVSYSAYLSEPRRTYQHKVDLDTRSELPVTLLKRYDTKGEYNR